jgi:hypothetical protein
VADLLALFVGLEAVGVDRPLGNDVDRNCTLFYSHSSQRVVLERKRDVLSVDGWWPIEKERVKKRDA